MGCTKPKRYEGFSTRTLLIDKPPTHRRTVVMTHSPIHVLW